MRHAIVDGEDVVNVVDYDEDISGQTPPGMEAPLMARLDAAGVVSPGWHYVDGAFVDPTPAPSPAPVTLITKRQMLLWLLGNKSKTEADIATALNTIGDPIAKAKALIEWGYPDGGILQRANPLFDQMGPLFSMTSDDIDAAFAAAAVL